MPALPILIYGNRVTALQTAIAELQRGAPSATFEGANYTSASLEALFRLYERYGVKAAIEAILQGAQSYSLSGVTYTRGDLRALQEQDRRNEQAAAKTTRAGMGIRYARFG